MIFKDAFLFFKTREHFEFLCELKQVSKRCVVNKLSAYKIDLSDDPTIQPEDNGNTSLHPLLSHFIVLIPLIVLITLNFIIKVNALVTFSGFGETRKDSVIF